MDVLGRPPQGHPVLQRRCPDALDLVVLTAEGHSTGPGSTSSAACGPLRLDPMTLSPLALILDEVVGGLQRINDAVQAPILG